MPVQTCILNGRPGFKWGEKGKCYTYPAGDKAGREAARAKARKQGQAIKASEIKKEGSNG